MLMFFFPKASPNKPITPGLSSFSIIKTFPSGTTSIACWFSLVKIGFFFPEEKAISMKSSLRNIWSRLPLTVSDVRAFHGILRHLLKSRNL